MSKLSTILSVSLLDFIDHSPTAWHCVKNCASQLIKAGFIELKEKDKWKLEPSKKYFVTRNGSSICAFVTPSQLPKKIRLIASHTDSPSLKLKPNPEIRKEGCILLSSEIYGAPLLSSWFNRDLGLAGQIYYTDEKDRLIEQLIILDQYPFTIPQLAIHLNRDVNEKGFAFNKQDHLPAIAGLADSIPSNHSLLESILKDQFSLKKLIGHELFFYPLEKARYTGYKNTLISAYRIDSLSSVYAGLSAMLKNSSSFKDEIKMVIFWDNEEVGSSTAQGAASPFFTQLLDRILYAYQADKEDMYCLLNNSICISVDLAHAVHPNYSEKHESRHAPILGQGNAIKFNAQQKYATSGKFVHLLETIAKSKNISLQKFVSRNDQPCGSTIGPIHASLTGMTTIDIGSPQLSMHASRELMAKKDHEEMCLLLEGLFE